MNHQNLVNQTSKLIPPFTAPLPTSSPETIREASNRFSKLGRAVCWLLQYASLKCALGLLRQLLAVRPSSRQDKGREILMVRGERLIAACCSFRSLYSPHPASTAARTSSTAIITSELYLWRAARTSGLDTENGMDDTLKVRLWITGRQ